MMDAITPAASLLESGICVLAELLYNTVEEAEAAVAVVSSSLSLVPAGSAGSVLDS